MTAKVFLTLEEFWALPSGETAYELVDGQAIPKVSPKYFHSSLQGAFYTLIRDWCKGFGENQARMGGNFRTQWCSVGSYA